MLVDELQLTVPTIYIILLKLNIFKFWNILKIHEYKNMNKNSFSDFPKNAEVYISQIKKIFLWLRFWFFQLQNISYSYKSQQDQSPDKHVANAIFHVYKDK